MELFIKKYLPAVLLFLYFLLLLININSIYLVAGDEKVYQSSVFALLGGRIDNNNHPLLAKSVWSFFVFLSEGYLRFDNPLVWRFGTVIFSLLTLTVFYKLSRLFFDKSISLSAAIFLALDPMFFTFSRLLQLEIIALFFNISSIYFFISFLRKFSYWIVFWSGFLLGLYLKVKLSSLVLIIYFPAFVVIRAYFRNKIFNKIFADNIKAGLLNISGSISGFVAGNFLFFVLDHGSVNFLNYVIDLVRSQFGSTAFGFQTSPAWSWFTIPQILTLYRLDWVSSVETIVTFQSPLLFIFTVPVLIIFSLKLISKDKLIFGKSDDKTVWFLILTAFLAQYLPWFFAIHATYYYYIIPLIPLLILMLIKTAQLYKFSAMLLKYFLPLCVLIFIIYFPLLVGFKVPKSYDLLLNRISVYKFPDKDTLFCQHCYPRK